MTTPVTREGKKGRSMKKNWKRNWKWKWKWNGNGNGNGNKMWIISKLLIFPAFE